MSHEENWSYYGNIGDVHLRLEPLDSVMSFVWAQQRVGLIGNNMALDIEQEMRRDYFRKLTGEM
jgi:hypothetical protein